MLLIVPPNWSGEKALKEQVVMCLNMQPIKYTYRKGDDLISMQSIYGVQTTQRGNP